LEETPDKKKKPAQTSYLAQSTGAISIAFEIGFIIALPVTILALYGKHLDLKYHTHFIVYIAMAVALGCSCLWLYLRLEDLVNKLKAGAVVSKQNQSKENLGQEKQEDRAEGQEANKEENEDE
jgi:hypothetical protein